MKLSMFVWSGKIQHILLRETKPLKNINNTTNLLRMNGSSTFGGGRIIPVRRRAAGTNRPAPVGPCFEIRAEIRWWTVEINREKRILMSEEIGRSCGIGGGYEWEYAYGRETKCHLGKMRAGARVSILRVGFYRVVELGRAGSNWASWIQKENGPAKELDEGGSIGIW